MTRNKPKLSCVSEQSVTPAMSRSVTVIVSVLLLFQLELLSPAECSILKSQRFPIRICMFWSFQCNEQNPCCGHYSCIDGFCRKVAEKDSKYSMKTKLQVQETLKSD
ncbi:uncharacterized protein LOC124370955 [Homalodisca vitripennis]|uniref:uncharacterized protein LOC124370955 n=1 Tax=Homalodisca vitripennis TaxID=197043 RepID=UPI001EEC8963|nr:uncharacterized protein LOC124370955 [Homalodisca vitripennis]